MADWDYLYSDAYTAFEEKDYLKGIECAGKALEMGCDNIDIYHIRGMCFYHLERHDEAIKDLEIYVPKKPTDFALRMNLGISYQKTGELEKCKILYDQVIMEQPTYALGYANRAVYYVLKEMWEEVIIEYDWAETFGYDHPSMYQARGAAYLNIQKYEEAKIDWKKYLELCPDHAIVIFQFGQIEQLLENIPSAIQYYSQAIYLEDTNTDFITQRMLAYMGNKQNALALEDMNRLIKLNPGSVKTKVNGVEVPVLHASLDENGEFKMLTSEDN
jgi:tetratricopeptide (TPR) repeat protein